MRKILLIAMLFIFTFYGCTGNDKVNLSVFIQNYNNISDYKIDYTYFSGKINETNTEYTFFVEEDNNKVLVTLKDNSKEIIEARISLIKVDDMLNNVEINNKQKFLFKKTVIDVACSFTAVERSEIEKIINKLTNNSVEAENTAEYKNYKLIYLIDDLCAEIIIRNKWFYEEETTLKPENINSFLNTAPIRTETVPHR